MGGPKTEELEIPTLVVDVFTAVSGDVSVVDEPVSATLDIETSAWEAAVDRQTAKTVKDRKDFKISFFGGSDLRYDSNVIETLRNEYGAGDGNRTHISSLEGYRITTMLRPHRTSIVEGRRKRQPMRALRLIGTAVECAIITTPRVRSGHDASRSK